jgi:hypothetical protein
MSKVKITGNASGTGVLTLEAPNTNTDRTISLPDSTDTLVGQSTTNALAATDTALTTRVNAVGGRKNLIINGGFDVWQRGTSFTKTSAGTAYHADRWSTYYNSNTITKVQEILGSTKQNCLKISQSTTANPFEISLKLEDSSVYSGKTFTISFYAKSSTGFSDLTISAFLRNASMTNLDSQYFASNVTIGTSFTKYSYTFTMLDKSALTLGEPGSHLGITFQRAYGIADFTITQVQLELGDQATDFEHRSYGEELALCQRYYQFGSTSTTYAGFANGANQNYFAVSLTTPLRSSPTVTRSISGAGWTSLKHNGSNISTTTPAVVTYVAGASNIAMKQTGHSGLSDMHVTNIYTAGSYIIFDAEL